MSKHSRTKLVPPKTKPEHQFLETIEESSLPEQKEEPVTVLDNEIECPRCNEIMELYSRFYELAYSCDSCSFLLKCI